MDNNPWLQPVALIGMTNIAIVILGMAFGGILYMTRGEAATASRVLTIENRIEYEILPTLKRIERKIDP